MINDTKYLPIKLNQLKLDLTRYINALHDEEGATYTAIKDALYGIFDELVVASNNEIKQLQAEFENELKKQNTQPTEEAKEETTTESVE